MIDQFNADGTGWARFSDDMTMRYRLARVLTHGAGHRGLLASSQGRSETDVDRCVFVMLNPSTADAFKHDPTVGECIKHSRRLGCDVLEVVNLFALMSPYPKDLKKRAHGFRGDDQANNDAIVAACVGATYVIAAWGTSGTLDHRADVVKGMLLLHLGVKLHHLGTTQDGHPKHPLARGKHRIPADVQPTEWMSL